jgi:hypothetical protein
MGSFVAAGATGKPKSEVRVQENGIRNGVEKRLMFQDAQESQAQGYFCLFQQLIGVSGLKRLSIKQLV